MGFAQGICALDPLSLRGIAVHKASGYRVEIAGQALEHVKRAMNLKLPIATDKIIPDEELESK